MRQIKYTSLAVIFLSGFLTTLAACAQSKKTKKHTPKPVLLQSTMQKTLPGRPEMEPTEELRFVIVWKTTDEPSAFFWRGAGTWQSCEVTKISKFKKLVVNANSPMALNYSPSRDQQFKKGDTLELYVMAAGKYPIPVEIPANKDSIIYYKTTKSKWLPIPVKNIIELPEIAMP